MHEKSDSYGILAGVIVIAGLLAVTLVFWDAFISATDKTGAQDFIGIALASLLKDPVGLLFNQTEGSSVFLKFWPLALAWIWGSYSIRIVFKKYTYFWSTLSWSIIATVVIFAAWWWAGAAQYNGWYACYAHISHGIKYPCYPGEQGSLDFTTHMATCAALAATLCTLDIMGLLGLHGYVGRALEMLIQYSSMAFLFPIWFEWQETLNPTLYWSVYLNSITDILAAMIVVLVVVLAYNLCVPFSEE